MSKKISIIIPIYNCESTIERAIKSVLNQSYDKFELILVNDGSTDNSDKIIKDFLKKYKNKYENKIIYIKQKNMGVSSARNVGLEICSGDYITFLDADDWIDENYFENIIIDIKEEDIIYYSYKVNNKIIELKHIDNIYKSKQLFIETMYNNNLLNPVCNKVVKKEIIKDIRFKRDIDLGEDCIFFLQVLNKCNNYKYINKSFYNYEATYSGLGFRNRNNLFLSKVKMINEIEKLYIENNFDVNFIHTLYARAYIAGYISLAKNENITKQSIIEYRKQAKSKLKNNDFSNLSFKYFVLINLLESSCYFITITISKIIAYIDILNKRRKFNV